MFEGRGSGERLALSGSEGALIERLQEDDETATGRWKATANGDTTRVVCKVRARVRLSRVRASHHAPRHREWPDFGFQLKFCSLSLFCFFWAFN